MRVEFDCAFCGKHGSRQEVQGANFARRYCNNICKSEWQRTQKPVSREWLVQKYVTEGLDTTQIGKLVNRDPKSVWSWLKDLDIPTRGRGTTGNGLKAIGKPRKPMSAETREKIRQARLKDGRLPYMKDGKHHLKGKRGADTPNWKGGVTPERQAVYGSLEWKAAVKIIWKRDNATCQRCKLHRSLGRKNGISFDIHHIVSFAVPELRCEPANLVLLCEPCHYWVHSNENTLKEFLK